MTTVLEVASYLLKQCRLGRGNWRMKLGTRGLDSLRPGGSVLDVRLPHAGDETSLDGQEHVFLRAADPKVFDAPIKE